MTSKIYSLFLLLLCLYAWESNAQQYKEWMNSTEVKVSDIVIEAESYLAANPSRKGRKLFERWKYNAVRQQDKNGYLRKPDLVAKELKKFIRTKKTISTERTSTSNWEELGPTSWNATAGYTPGVGRITSFAQHPTDPNTMIIGAATGGIWKSTNGGSTWLPLTDNALSMTVYSLAIDPTTPTTYYWGSSKGKIYKSTDAGVTWNLNTTLTYEGEVNKIVVHPTNSMNIYATSEDSGIYATDDGGVSWYEPVSDASGFDIEFKPSDPNTIYLSGNDFYVTTDNGFSWTTVSGFASGQPKMIGVSADDPTKVYVVEAMADAFGAVYVSSNSGSSFTKLTHTQNFFGYEQDGSGLTDGQAPRDMGIAVSPTDADEVHIAGINTWRSIDGGISFSPTSNWAYNGSNSYCHADVDDLVFVGATLVVLSDGGIYMATNSKAAPSSSFYTDMSTGMGIHQFYKFGVSQTSSAVITGGAQDNGNSVFVGGAWKNWIGADGMEGFVDKTNTNIIYGAQQMGGLFKSTDGGITNIDIDEPTAQPGNWVTPFEQDPIAANTIYSGYTRVYKSTDAGDSWTAISQDFGGNLDNLKIAPSDNNIMFASKGAELYKTITGTGTWTMLSGFTGDNVNSIAIHPTDPNKVAIATTSSDKVYVSTDGGSTWTPKNTGLPDFSALCLVWQNSANNCLYLGMDYGIYYINDIAPSWTIYSNQLPNVQVNELEINTADSKLYAATYGRGIWKSDLHAPIVLPIELGDFQAKLNNKSVDLSWFTLSEVNNDYFIIQKSTDGITWKDMERVASKGNSISRVDYKAIDKTPFTGVNYYRLIDVDLTGKKEYSKVVSVNLTGIDLISIFPNPSKGDFLIYTDAVKDSKFEILIFNSVGKLIKSETMQANSGANEIPLKLNVNPGIYFLTLRVDGVNVYQGKRLVVQH